MPTYLPGDGGHGHMVLGRGPKGYIITLVTPGEERAMLMLEVWATGMIEAVAMAEELTVGEVVSALKLWAT